MFHLIVKGYLLDVLANCHKRCLDVIAESADFLDVLSHDQKLSVVAFFLHSCCLLETQASFKCQLQIGDPSEETRNFQKSLERPFEAHVQDQEATRLFGTNFDASLVNQDMLKKIPGEMFYFKARDEGN